jgi:hypothetical protein
MRVKRKRNMKILELKVLVMISNSEMEQTGGELRMARYILLSQYQH